MVESSYPLEGIRVVAFETTAAGPFSTQILADMGAGVIKIERPHIGDTIRQWDTAVRGLSSGYVWLNRNKRSISVDLKREAGRDVVHRLVQEADVFFENFAPGVADGLGLGYQALRTKNPALVYCSISGYGQDGPYRNRKAFDLLLQGETGLIASTGYPDRPAKVSVPFDISAGMYAAIGTLLALHQRERTGEGQFVDISMFDSILSWLAYFPHHYWHQGELPERVGLRHHYVTPYGPFLARDNRYVNFAVASGKDWEVFCEKVIDRPDLLAQPRFKTVESRRRNRAELEELVVAIFLERDSGEWFERLESAKLPYGEVRGMDEVLEHPQVPARHLIRYVESQVGSVPVIANPIRMSESAVRYDRVPALGEDTRAVLLQAGYREDEIALLLDEGVI